MADLPASYTAVIGFLTPIFTDEMTGMNGLARHDFDKVAAGYACADCLAEFAHYMPRCPICGLERDVTKDLGTAPDLWNQHLKERDGPITERRARTPEEAIAGIFRDKDVEQIPLSKLKPRRRG